jgi:hypothetical protein
MSDFGPTYRPANQSFNRDENETPAGQTFDIEKMDLSNKLQELHQEGNYLVGVTDKGIRFRQHIPQGKILDMKGGKYIFKDMVIV